MPNLEILIISENHTLLDCKERIIKSVIKYLKKLEKFAVFRNEWDIAAIQKEHEFLRGKIQG